MGTTNEELAAALAAAGEATKTVADVATGEKTAEGTVEAVAAKATVEPAEGAGEQKEVKTFTQEEVNEIVKTRLARANADFKNYDSLKEKADKLDELEAARKKLAEENSTILSEKKNLELTALRYKIAFEEGLSSSAVELLSGTSEDEIRQKAALVKTLAGASSPNPFHSKDYEELDFMASFAEKLAK